MFSVIVSLITLFHFHMSYLSFDLNNTPWSCAVAGKGSMVHGTKLPTPGATNASIQQKLQHTPISHTRSAIPRSPTMKGIRAYSPLVKVARGVLFQLSVETTLESKSPKGWRGVLVSTHLRKHHMQPFKLGMFLPQIKGEKSTNI